MDNYNKVDLKKLMKIIEEQFLSVMQDDYEYYQKFNVILSREQQFIKSVDKKPNSIYIVVKFLSANFNYGQIVQPITINAISEANKLEACQRLLSEYAAKFHYGATIEDEENNDLIKQTYIAPVVMSNFNEVGEAYRSLLFMSGTFLIGKNSFPISRIEWANPKTNEYEEVPFLTSHWGWAAQLDSQGFYYTQGRTVSETRLGTLVFNFTIYQTQTNFCKEIIDLVFNAERSINPTFTFLITFKDNTFKTIDFKCSQIENNQNIGEFPVLSLAFTR